MLNNKKSKIVGYKTLTKVIDRIQCELMDLGDVTYDIKREPSPTDAYSTDSFFDKILDLFFGGPTEEHLIVILYSRDNCRNCVWTSVEMDAVLRAISKERTFTDQELISSLVRKLRLAFEALK